MLSETDDFETLKGSFASLKRKVRRMSDAHEISHLEIAMISLQTIEVFSSDEENGEENEQENVDENNDDQEQENAVNILLD